MICEVCCVAHWQPRTQTPCHHGDYSIAGAGNIKHLAGARGEMYRRLASLNEGHTRLTAGHEYAIEIQRRSQRLGSFNQSFVCVATADDRFELGEIRRQKRGTAITLKIEALGIYQRRFVQIIAVGQQWLNKRQRSLGIVTEYHQIRVSEMLLGIPHKQVVGMAGKRFLKVDAQKLLITAQHPELDDRLSRARHHIPANAR